jgi:hypothetical protein
MINVVLAFLYYRKVVRKFVRFGRVTLQHGSSHNASFLLQHHCSKFIQLSLIRQRFLHMGCDLDERRHQGRPRMETMHSLALSLQTSAFEGVLAALRKAL